MAAIAADYKGANFEKGQKVVYRKAGVERLASIVAKHLDDYPDLYYTICFEDGHEKQTDSKYLSVAPVSPAYTISMLTGDYFQKERNEPLEDALKQLGHGSAVAQNLSVPITSAKKLVENSDQVLFLATDSATNVPVGFIKFGPKDLYFYTRAGAVKNMHGQVCLLDFYVEESQQRRGCGIYLFQEMLTYLNNPPANYLAYDRPSPKLLSFMAKHFGLCSPDLQPNKYTIFEGFPL